MTTLDKNQASNNATNATNTTTNTNTPPTSKTSKTKPKQAQNTPQKLTLVNIAKESKQLDEFKEVSLLDGKYTVKIRQKFLPSKIQQFIHDLQDALLILKSEQTSMQDAANYFILFNMCVLKHFSDLGINHLKLNKKKDIQKLLEVASQLLDLGIFEAILNEFDEEEIAKLTKTIEKMKDIDDQIGDMFVTATLNEQERLKEMGLEMVSKSENDDLDSGLDGDI